jgi:hypothetical protein
MNVEWTAAAAHPDGERKIDQSLGRLEVNLLDTPITSFKSDKGDVGTRVEIPLYYLAEWLTANWWPLLCEPKKTESDADQAFQARHWLGTARNGFALPDVWIIPTGDQVEITARDTYLRFARLSFTENLTAVVSRAELCSAFSQFVSEVLDRLTKFGVRDTAAHETWQLIQETSTDQVPYCELVGSLGLNPYDEHEQIDEVLDRLSDKLPFKIVADLCQAADEQTFLRWADLTSTIYDALPRAQTFDASELSALEIPVDNAALAWRWGVASATRMRQHLGVSSKDPGGERLFEAFRIDPGARVAIDSPKTTDFSRVSAALGAEDERTVHLALAEAGEQQRRFSAARAVFLAWSSREKTSPRLVTRARTRDQQASRAFAAELLAPIAYIRTRTGGNTISSYRVDEIADELEISPAVVRFQAQNNKMFVAEAWT